MQNSIYVQKLECNDYTGGEKFYLLQRQYLFALRWILSVLLNGTWDLRQTGDPWPYTGFRGPGTPSLRWWEINASGILVIAVHSLPIRRSSSLIFLMGSNVLCLWHLLHGVELSSFPDFNFPHLGHATITLPNPPRPITVILFSFLRATCAAEFTDCLLFKMEDFTVYFCGCPFPISNLL